MFAGRAFGYGVNGRPAVAAATLTFTSWIHEVDVVNAGLDVVVLTSLNEGTPVSLIEAQAANRPIVSTNVGGIENVVLPGRTALLSPPGEAGALADNLLRVIDDEDLRQRMSGSGWTHVRERYHYTRLVRETSELYRSLLS